MTYGLFDERNTILKSAGRPAPPRPVSSVPRNIITDAAKRPTRPSNTNTQKRSTLDDALLDMRKVSGDGGAESRGQAGFNQANVGRAPTGLEKGVRDFSISKAAGMFGADIAGPLGGIAGLAFAKAATAEEGKGLESAGKSAALGLFSYAVPQARPFITAFNLMTSIFEALTKEDKPAKPVSEEEVAARVAKEKLAAEMEAAAKAAASAASGGGGVNNSNDAFGPKGYGYIKNGPDGNSDNGEGFGGWGGANDGPSGDGASGSQGSGTGGYGGSGDGGDGGD